MGCEKDEPLPEASFSISKTTAKVNEEISFINQSKNATEYIWDFGDETYSTYQNPIHTYSKSGTYSVNLMAIGKGGKDTKEQSISITIPDPEWLIYDDGIYEGNIEAQPEYFYFLVLFDKPESWPKVNVTKVKIKFSSPGSIKLSCWNTIYSDGAYYPNSQMYSEENVVVTDGWNEWSVDWVLEDDNFIVGYFQPNSYDPNLYFDISNPDLRSYLLFYDYGLVAYLFTDVDWAIKVYVQYYEVNNKNEKPVGKWIDGTFSMKNVKSTNIQNVDKPNIKKTISFHKFKELNLKD
jgi:PKD repeat protein